MRSRAAFALSDHHHADVSGNALEREAGAVSLGDAVQMLWNGSSRQRRGGGDDGAKSSHICLRLLFRLVLSAGWRRTFSSSLCLRSSPMTSTCAAASDSMASEAASAGTMG